MENLLNNIELLWLAKEAFRFPEENNMNDIKPLFTWGVEVGDAKVNQLIEQIEPELQELELLQVDYTNLFINSFPTAKAHPFAGWYLGEEITYGDNSQALANFYAEYEVFYDIENASLPADHIMVELEFIAIMGEEYLASGNKRYWQAMEKMINNHMDKWVVQFLDTVECKADTAYYKAIAIIVKLLLTNIKQELKEVA